MTSSALALPNGQPRKPVGDAYLKFQLTRQTSAVFATPHVQEAIALPTRRLTPMPNMPPCMLGLMNRRSRVMWVVDLAQLLGIPNPDAPGLRYNVQHNVVLLQVGSVSLGLAIQQVKGISWIENDTIQSPIGQVSASLVPYLRGCVLQQHDQQKELVLVLDAEAIVKSPILVSP